MPISGRQKKQFQTWLSEHDVSTTCPTCGSDGGWNLHDEFFGGLDLDLKKKKASPSSLGCFALVCKHCQNIRFFAAAPILGK